MSEFPNIEPYDIIEVFGNPEMRFVCNDECEVIIEKDIFFRRLLSEKQRKK